MASRSILYFIGTTTYSTIQRLKTENGLNLNGFQEIINTSEYGSILCDRNDGVLVMYFADTQPT